MDILGIAGFVVGGAGVLGFAGAALYTGRAKALISLQQDEVTALKESNTRLSEENHALQFRTVNSEAEVARLNNQVKSVPAFEKMSIQMAKQHKEVITTLAKVAEELAKVAASINANARDNNRRERHDNAK